MAIEVAWDDEAQTRLLYTFPEYWSWDEFHEAKELADAMIDSRGRRIGLIFDVHRVQTLPVNMLTGIKPVIVSRHPDGKPLVLVGKMSLIKSLYVLITRLYGNLLKDFMLVSTLDEARQAIDAYQRQYDNPE